MSHSLSVGRRTFRAELEFSRRVELVMDEEDAARHAVHKARLDKIEGFYFRALRLLAQYWGNREMAIDCLVLAHGQGEMIGLYTATDVAVKHFADPKKKAAVTKCIKMFQQALDLPPMPGQRSDAGRRAMELARRKQLKKTNV
jgi:hypothetical protein